MEDFEYECRTRIIFGKNTEKLVGDETKRYAEKVLLHYGKEHIKKSGLHKRVVDSLKKAGVGFIELDGVLPNPRLDLVRQGIQICRQNNIRFILAVGGGSVIDSAKAIALGVDYQGDVWDFYEGKAPIEKALPIATILTIPAAGSESSPATVISDMENNRKLAASSDELRPVFSILNPELTYTLPDWHTSAGAVDMMLHIFERYFTNTLHVEVTDRMCEGLLKAIISNTRKIKKNPKDYDARAELMWASTLAHNGMLGTGREEDWATHRIEHELSAFYDITHGAGLAVISPAWMRYVVGHDTKRFAMFCRNVWGIEEKDDRKAAERGILATKDYFREIGMPTTLRELNIDSSKFEIMADLCGEVGNFVKLKPKDIVKIYQMAL